MSNNHHTETGATTMNIRPFKRVDFSRTVGHGLKGYVVTTRERLVELFGEPDMGYDSKTSIQWTLNLYGVIVSIYDYWTPAKPGEEYEFHIGGQPGAVEAVQKFLPQAQIRRMAR